MDFTNQKPCVSVRILQTGTPAKRKPNLYAFHLNAYTCQPFQLGTKRITYFTKINVLRVLPKYVYSFNTSNGNQTCYSNALGATEERNAVRLYKTYIGRTRTKTPLCLYDEYIYDLYIIHYVKRAHP